MAYSAEVIKRARDRLDQANTDRKSENLQHMEIAYRQLPRLREIDRQLQQTMLAAVRASFTPGCDVEAELEKAKQANLALQQERANLIALHFEEGYLDETPICSRCGGSGYLGTSMCECLQELCRQDISCGNGRRHQNGIKKAKHAGHNVAADHIPQGVS